MLEYKCQHGSSTAQATAGDRDGRYNERSHSTVCLLRAPARGHLCSLRAHDGVVFMSPGGHPESSLSHPPGYRVSKILRDPLPHRVELLPRRYQNR